MKYSIDSRNPLFVYCCGFLSKNTSKNINKMLCGKCSQNLLYHAKKLLQNGLKTTLKGVIQKTAEATNNLADNKFGDRLTRVESRSNPETPSRTDENSIQIPKERCKLPKKPPQVFEELTLK